MLKSLYFLLISITVSTTYCSPVWGQNLNQEFLNRFILVHNRWKNDQYLNVEHGEIASSPISMDWWSAQWILEPAEGGLYYRIRNKWKHDQYLNIEHGFIVSSPINMSWWSAQWSIEQIFGTQFFRIKNRWKPDRYLNIENNIIQCSNIQSGWWSAQWTLEPITKYELGDKIVRSEYITSPLPRTIAQAQGFSSPALANEQTAKLCWNRSNGNKNYFIDCMAGKILSTEKKKAYDCVRQYQNNKEQVAMCLLKSRMGEQERKALDQAEKCLETYGKNFSQYSLCLASKNSDPTTARAIACYQQQAETGSFSYWQAAICFTGPQFNLNTELIIAAECAITSGGEPMVFIGCAGGRLTAREIDKCFTHGVGGNGCFGPNNDIIKAAKQYGNLLNTALGKQHPFARVWNDGIHDISQGAGPNNDLVKFGKTIHNSINDVTNGPGKNNDVRKAVNKICPGLW